MTPMNGCARPAVISASAASARCRPWTNEDGEPQKPWRKITTGYRIVGEKPGGR